MVSKGKTWRRRLEKGGKIVAQVHDYGRVYRLDRAPVGGDDGFARYVGDMSAIVRRYIGQRLAAALLVRLPVPYQPVYHVG
jgi:hypothetical protein